MTRDATTIGSPRNLSSSDSAAGARNTSVAPTCDSHWVNEPPS